MTLWTVEESGGGSSGRVVVALGVLASDTPSAETRHDPGGGGVSGRSQFLFCFTPAYSHYVFSCKDLKVQKVCLDLWTQSTVERVHQFSTSGPDR